jgi:quercetin dioxygenase-like cupin family protein
MRAGEQPVIDRGGGVRTSYLVGPSVGAGEFQSGVTEFDAGASLPEHWHDCEESVMVIEGAAIFSFGERRVPMDTGDVTWVPAGSPHRFINRGSGRLRILWTYGKVGATRTLALTGETVPIELHPRRSWDQR